MCKNHPLRNSSARYNRTHFCSSIGNTSLSIDNHLSYVVAIYIAVAITVAIFVAIAEAVAVAVAVAIAITIAKTIAVAVATTIAFVVAVKDFSLDRSLS